ncbi:MAG: SAM-dependent chlorinase/fluorinase [Desulforegulaceae bacterium]|nr:SAM-dependent chlorinase/fluorinase [Desulforegulaceae bacterium]
MINPLVLVTDFGTKDPYSAVVKGVLLSINKKFNIIDATHEISSGNIAEASRFLNSIISWYPEGSVFICVVDPGVGSERKILVLKSLNRIITAPDNGVVSDLVKKHGIQELYFASKKHFISKATFDGRDIFAPLGAALAEKGTNLSFLEKAVPENIVLKDFYPAPKSGEDLISGEIVNIDKYGNLITNISKNCALRAFRSFEDTRVYLGEQKLGSIVYTYSSSAEGKLITLWNSSDFLEIACVNKSAEKKLGNKVKDKVFLKSVFYKK